MSDGKDPQGRRMSLLMPAEKVKLKARGRRSPAYHDHLLMEHEERCEAAAQKDLICLLREGTRGAEQSGSKMWRSLLQDNKDIEENKAQKPSEVSMSEQHKKKWWLSVHCSLSLKFRYQIH